MCRHWCYFPLNLQLTSARSVFQILLQGRDVVQGRPKTGGDTKEGSWRDRRRRYWRPRAASARVVMVE